MSGRDPRVPSEMTDIPDPKLAVDDECTDSGYLSGVVSETLSGEVSNVNSGNVRDEQASASLSQSFSRVSLGSNQTARPDSIPRPLARDLPPWQLLFQHDDEGDTQLHIAAIRGCLNSVRTLVSVCPALDLLDLPNDYGQTALHLAVLGGHQLVARTLVQEGAKIDCRDCMGETPLHIAATSGNKSCMQALLTPVPNKKPHVTYAALNQKNYNGETSIHCAALGGYTDIVQMLVFYGADINAREGLGGYTALHMAAERGDTPLAQYLLEKCASVEVGELNYAGKTARQLAARTGVATVFSRHPLRDDEDYYPSSDDEYDDDGDEVDLDGATSLFSKLRDGMEQSIPVA